MPEPTPPIDPRHTALLVMDVQPAIVDRLGDGDELLSRLREAVSTARRHGVQVGYVRVAFAPEDIAAIPAHARMGRRVESLGDRLHTDAPGAQVHADVAPQPGDIVVRKTRVGAFSTTDLDDQLRDRGITTLLLAGVSTSGVVLSTVRDAHDRDYQVLVLSDATSDPSPEVHAVLTEQVFPAQADVISTAELDALLSD